MADNEKKIAGLAYQFRYPSDDLLTCLDFSKKIYLASKRNYISTPTLAQDLQLNNGNKGKREIASLKYYGILEQHPEEETYKLHEEVLEYVVNDILSKETILFFLNKVPINKKIFSRWNINELPSINEIRLFLTKDCGYNSKHLEEYSDIFKKDIDLYKEKIDINIENDEEEKYDSIIDNNEVENIDSIKKIAPSLNKEKIEYHYCKLSDGQLTVEYPTILNSKDKIIIKHQLEFLIKMLDYLDEDANK